MIRPIIPVGPDTKVFHDGQTLLVMWGERFSFWGPFSFASFAGCRDSDVRAVNPVIARFTRSRHDMQIILEASGLL